MRLLCSEKDGTATEAAAGVAGAAVIVAELVVTDGAADWGAGSEDGAADRGACLRRNGSGSGIAGCCGP